MNRIENRMVKYLLAKPSIALAGRHPSNLHLSIMLSLNDIQLTAKQLAAVAKTVKEKAPCKLLVFGLGYDSLFWVRLNRAGKTVFLEDQDEWFQKIAKASKEIVAFPVRYQTRRTDWMRLLESPSLLDMPLPDDITKEKWDVILVDGPAGQRDEKPGRMSSIYLASTLVKDDGDVFVHDTDREIEDVYCNRFLGKENLSEEIKEPVGDLRHYRLPGLPRNPANRHSRKITQTPDEKPGKGWS